MTVVFMSTDECNINMRSDTVAQLIAVPFIARKPVGF